MPIKNSSDESKESSDDGFEDFQEPEDDSQNQQTNSNQINGEDELKIEPKQENDKDIDDKYDFDADLHLPNEIGAYNQSNENSSNKGSQEENKNDDSFDDFWEPEQIHPQIDLNELDDEEDKNPKNDSQIDDEQSDKLAVPTLNIQENFDSKDSSNSNEPNQKPLDSESDDIEIKADDSSDESPPQLSSEFITNDLNLEPQNNEKENQITEDNVENDEFEDFVEPQIEEPAHIEEINQDSKPSVQEDLQQKSNWDEDNHTNDIQVEHVPNLSENNSDNFDNPKSNSHCDELQKEVNADKPDEIELKADSDSFDDFAQPEDNSKNNDENTNDDVIPPVQIDDKSNSFEDFEEPVNNSNNHSNDKNSLDKDDKIELQADNDSFEDFKEPIHDLIQGEENKNTENCKDELSSNISWKEETLNIVNENGNIETAQNNLNEVELKANSDSFEDFAITDKANEEPSQSEIVKDTPIDIKDDSFKDFEEPKDNNLPVNHINLDENKQNLNLCQNNTEVKLEEIVIQQPDQIEDISNQLPEDENKVQRDAAEDNSFEEFTEPNIVQTKEEVKDDDSFDDFADPNEVEAQHQENKQKIIEGNSSEFEENNQELNLPSNRSQKDCKNEIKYISDNSDDVEIKPDEDSFEDFEEPIASQKEDKHAEIVQNDSFEDFADPDNASDHDNSSKLKDDYKPKQAENIDNSESDKIEMKEDEDSFDDFADPDNNNQVTGSSEQPVSDQLRIPENYQETSSRSEGIELKEDDSFDDFAEPEGNKNNEENKNQIKVDKQNEDSDFDDFNEPEENPVEESHKDVEKPKQIEESKPENLEIKEKSTETSSPISSSSTITTNQTKGIFGQPIDEFWKSESYLTYSSSSKSSISDISKRLIKTPISFDLKEISSRYDSLIEQEVRGYTNRNIPSFTTTYSVKDLFER